jgi:hypothetical protein
MTLFLQREAADEVRADYYPAPVQTKDDGWRDAGTAEVDANGVASTLAGRVNESPELCAVCHAPSGKPHSKTCTATAPVAAETVPLAVETPTLAV